MDVTKDVKVWCHRCQTEFSLSANPLDQMEGLAYGECPGCNKAGSFGIIEDDSE